MEELYSFTEKLTDWQERLLLKGIYKLDKQDLQELKKLQELATEYDMSFLGSLIEDLHVEGNRYLQEVKADAELLTQQYLYVVQYVNMMKKPLTRSS
ncbi:MULTISPECIES: hypothetical protein [Brevibacillus]|uniref:hypothetical protein n=1 Tax=Brevibacillus TaxID=55080 RepID=UPI000D0F4657|nr:MULTISPECIES: hypothetical protein [Brevibacillus]MED1944117.1 hypothetical protein [Brevibacillus formosus]MED1999511.1 hypothetical protein [Brevibacillus formosus]MED2082352.1 hypothetical protein [Brevibacillus formosus]PSK18737.1 hypothetical protein C7R94_08025 [Brevibacillus sp. NRRL NRS-603]